MDVFYPQIKSAAATFLGAINNYNVVACMAKWVQVKLHLCMLFAMSLAW
jgi:hypothetical protein